MNTALIHTEYIRVGNISRISVSFELLSRHYLIQS